MRKVYHVQQFFNEKQLLKIKLGVEFPFVDWFLFSESNITHQGNPKQFNFIQYEREDYLEEFTHPTKIIIQREYDTPDDYVNLKNDPTKDVWYNLVIDKLNSQTHWNKSETHYGRDSYQKEILLRGLGGMHPNDDDIIIFSDLDEIINPEAILWLRENFDPEKIYKFDCKFFYYRLNLLITSEKWQSPMAMSWKNFLKNSVCAMRNFAEAEIIPNGGWHFSYLGNAEQIITKIENFSEKSFNQNWVKFNVLSAVENALQYGRDMTGRKMDFKIIPYTEQYYPKYMIDHKDEYKDLIL